MATKNPGIIVKPPFDGQRADLDRRIVPEGSAYILRNWVLHDGKLMVRPGFINFGTSLSAPSTGLVQYDHHTGNRYTVIGTPTKWWYYDLVTRDFVDITDGGDPLTGTYASNQIFRTFYKSGKTYVVGVNGYTDTPKCWDGEAANYSKVGGIPDPSKCIAINNNRMLLGNQYTTQPEIYRVDVSNFNDFESGWNSVQTVNLADTPGELISLNEFGNLVTVAYKSDAIYLITAQDALEPFVFELKLAKIKGPVSPQAIVSTPVGHIYMAEDGSFWLFNGVSLVPLDRKFGSFVRGTADLGALWSAYGFYDARQEETWFMFKGVGSSVHNYGVIIKHPELTVWPVKFNGITPSAGYGARIQDSIRIGDMVDKLSYYTDPLKALSHNYYRNMLVGSDGQIVTEGGYDDAGTAIPMEYEGPLVCPNEDQRRTTTVLESQHFFIKTDESQEVSVQIGYTPDGSDPQYTSAQTINLSTGDNGLGHRTTSRFFSLKLSGSINKLVEWYGSVISGVQRGYR